MTTPSWLQDPLPLRRGSLKQQLHFGNLFSKFGMSLVTLKKWFSTLLSYAGFRACFHTPRQFHPIQVSFIPSRCPALAPETPPGYSSLGPFCPTRGFGHGDTAGGLAEAVDYTRAETQDSKWQKACHDCSHSAILEWKLWMNGKSEPKKKPVLRWVLEEKSRDWQQL